MVNQNCESLDWGRVGSGGGAGGGGSEWVSVVTMEMGSLGLL